MSSTRLDLSDVDLAIIVWGEPPEVLARSCAALSAAMGLHWSGSLLLVENGRSAAGARELVRRIFPDATRVVIRAQENLGFGGAVNVAMAHSSAQYVGVFNPDGVADADMARELLRALGDHPGALLAAATIAPLGPAATSASGAPAPAEWVPGTACLYRRDAFLAVGGFDPLYFMYCEDVDLSKRAREQGLTLLRVPTATFHHEHSATGSAQALRLRHFTASATTLSYRYASSRLRVLGVLARKRARWFRAMAKARRWWWLGGAVLGSVVWLARVPEIERRRRRPWDGEALLAWLDGVSEEVETAPLR